MSNLQEFVLERYFAEYEFNTKHLLCCSDCDTLSAGQLCDMDGDGARQGLFDVSLGYTESKGLPELREEIAKLYDNATAEDVLLLHGAEEGIYMFARAFFQPGDRVAVVMPAYQSLYEVARSQGAHVIEWKLVEDGGGRWSLNMDTLKSAFAQGPIKAVVVNSPHNPTGWVISPKEQRELVELCRDNDTILFGDEVYFGLERFDNIPSRTSVAYEKGISLGVMSKAYGLAGLRIGWIVCRNDEILEKFASYKDYTTICCSAPSEYLSVVALRNAPKVLARIRSIIDHNMELLDAFFKKHEDIFAWERPKAGCVAFPRIKLNVSAELMCHDLVVTKSTLLLPSTKFQWDDRHFRLGFGRANMNQALTEFDNFVTEHKASWLNG